MELTKILEWLQVQAEACTFLNCSLKLLGFYRWVPFFFLTYWLADSDTLFNSVSLLVAFVLFFFFFFNFLSFYLPKKKTLLLATYSPTIFIYFLILMFTLTFFVKIDRFKIHKKFQPFKLRFFIFYSFLFWYHGNIRINDLSFIWHGCQLILLLYFKRNGSQLILLSFRVSNFSS